MIDQKELRESGILLVDKPVDWTSHDVVNCVRRRFGIRKVGHCGTLDPGATGLLVLLLGAATRLSDKLMGQDKVYRGVMRLGIETSSQDAQGTTVAEKDWSMVTAEDVGPVVAEFVGGLMQVPPMVSAIKMGGQPLYKLARKGREVEREPRPVRINYINIERIALPDIEFEIGCSKGTYVRTICHDIGQRLGCGACLQNLRRLKSGRFDVADAYGIDTIKSWELEDLMNAKIHLEQVFKYLQA